MRRLLLIAALMIAGTPAGARARLSPPPVWNQWETQPSQADIDRVYPAKAWNEDRSGFVTLHCQIGPDRRLHRCRVWGTTPEDPTFGEAALKLVPLYRAKVERRSHLPGPNAKVKVGVNFWNRLQRRPASALPR